MAERLKGKFKECKELIKLRHLADSEGQSAISYSALYTNTAKS